MTKKTVSIAAAFIAAFLFLATLPAQAECDPGSEPDDPDCRLSPFQSQQVNPGAVSGDGSTGEVSSGGSSSSASTNDMPLVSSDSLDSSNSPSSGTAPGGDQKSGTKGQEPKSDGAAQDSGQKSEAKGQEPKSDGAAQDGGQKSETKGQDSKADRAAGTVAAVLTGAAALGITAAATAPVWVTIGAVGLVGAGISYGLNRLIDVDALKEDVADGLRAWGGIADNAETIGRIAVERGGDLIEDAGQAISRTANSFVNSLFGGGS